jgi:outer membrane protein assembly factor BamB
VFVSDTCKGSPCLVDGTLVVTGEKAVFGLDPNTGSNRWQTAFPRVPGKADMQTLRGTTPAVWRHQGRSILLTG